MGASGWHYVTDYDEDAEAALQRVRQEVFESGDYMTPLAWVREALGQRSIPLPVRLLIAGAGMPLLVTTTFRWLARGGRGPRTIDELLEIAGEDGTHSILDITHTSRTREFGAAVPLSDPRLIRFFGDEHPTASDLDDRLDRIIDDVNRWEAVYFPIYRDGAPAGLVFAGASGD